MAETEFYPQASTALTRPEVPVATEVPSSSDLPSRAELVARVAELERVVATLASLRQERFAAERPDPVALTAALHPGGRRGARKPKRRTSSDGTIPLRFLMFDPTAPR